MFDASLVLKLPKGWSVIGFFFYLLVGGETNVNGPIVCSSKMVTCLEASVAEVELELEATFQSVQQTVQHRQILHDFGYPPTGQAHSNR